jgi:hypothetical protein
LIDFNKKEEAKTRKEKCFFLGGVYDMREQTRSLQFGQGVKQTLDIFLERLLFLECIVAA